MKIIKRLFTLIFISLIVILSGLGFNYLFNSGSFPIQQIVMVNKLDEHLSLSSAVLLLTSKLDKELL